MLENYYSSKSTDELLQNPATLAIINHSDGSVSHGDGCLSSGLQGLTKNTKEVWSLSQPSIIERGATGDCQWSKTDDVLFISTLGDKTHSDISQTTEDAYSELLTISKQQGYNHPIRFWNYLPEINVGAGDDENYKIFCTGRLKAFRSKQLDDQAFPAASAVGHLTQGIAIGALISKQPGVHFSNSLQIEAYQYPRQYGCSSPSFARATRINQNINSAFFISGTASILGHATVYKDDLLGQLETTHANIKHLLEKTDKSLDSVQTMKIYVRHAEHLTTIENKLATDFPKADKLFLQADICRDDLLVEIECFCE